jgi:predicted transcriptional regulator
MKTQAKKKQDDMDMVEEMKFMLECQPHTLNKVAKLAGVKQAWLYGVVHRGVDPSYSRLLQVHTWLKDNPPKGY